MADYRQIHTRIWKDGWFLDLTTDEKLLFIYLFSNERASVAGIYELSLRVMCFESGLNDKTTTAALAVFSKAGKVHYSNGIVWVVNLRRYNENSSPKVAARIARDLAEIPDCKLKNLYIEHYNHIPGDGYGTHTVSVPYSESISEQEQEQEHHKPKNGAARSAAPVRDELFDAIAEVCHVDPATAGSSIAKVKQALLKASPPYSPSEVRAFGVDWWAWAGRSEAPSIWKLQEQIGKVRASKPTPASAPTGTIYQ